MEKETPKYTKTYMSSCFECKKDFETEQRIDNCPDCNKLLKNMYERLVLQTKSAYIYYHQCETCKIEYVTDKKEQVCHHCGQLAENVGIKISEPIPTTIWQKLGRKIREYLP